MKTGFIGTVIFALVVTSCGTASQALKKAEQEAYLDRQMDSMSTVLSKNILEQAKSQLMTASTLLDVAKNSEAIRQAIREELTATNNLHQDALKKGLSETMNIAVFFDVSSNKISLNDQQSLFVWWLNVQSQVQDYSKIKVTLLGYSDPQFTPEYNSQLRTKRANSVKDWIQKFTEIKADQITIIDEPKPSTKDYMLDRRVEVKVSW